MGLESATYVSDLVTSNPATTDLQSQGDDHLRLLKAVLQATFPNSSKAFRFQSDVAEKVAPYTVVFPVDQNRIIQVTPSASDLTITLPSPNGVNANGWEVTIQKKGSGAGNVIVAGTINSVTNYTIYRSFAAVRFIYIVNQSMWIALPLFEEFATGVSMLFHQTAAPTGWVKKTGTAYEEAAIRNTTGTVDTGGTTDFTDVLTARTILQANLPDVDLTAASNGSHDHGVTGGIYGGIGTASWGSDGGGVSGPAGGGQLIDITPNGDHTHVVPLGGSDTPMNFAVKYIDTIVADKA